MTTNSVTNKSSGVTQGNGVNVSYKKEKYPEVDIKYETSSLMNSNRSSLKSTSFKSHKRNPGHEFHLFGNKKMSKNSNQSKLLGADKVASVIMLDLAEDTPSESTQSYIMQSSVYNPELSKASQDSRKGYEVSSTTYTKKFKSFLTQTDSQINTPRNVFKSNRITKGLSNPDKIKAPVGLKHSKSGSKLHQNVNAKRGQKQYFIANSRDLLTRNPSKVPNIALSSSSTSSSNPSFRAAKKSMHNLIQKCTQNTSSYTNLPLKLAPEVKFELKKTSRQPKIVLPNKFKSIAHSNPRVQMVYKSIPK